MNLLCFSLFRSLLSFFKKSDQRLKSEAVAEYFFHYRIAEQQKHHHRQHKCVNKRRKRQELWKPCSVQRYEFHKKAVKNKYGEGMASYGRNQRDPSGNKGHINEEHRPAKSNKQNDKPMYMSIFETRIGVHSVEHFIVDILVFQKIHRASRHKYGGYCKNQKSLWW